jgi:glyoxylase-like metal-dependent hydrolase (beta-lactamase superfamily II)
MSIYSALLRLLRDGSLVLLTALLAACGGGSGNAPAAVDTVRIYIFDNGEINGLDTHLFNFEPFELAEVDFVNRSYLVVHPSGTLMFDAGAVPDSAFDEHDGGPVVEGFITAETPLLPQLASIGYTPADVDYFALSHYHFDHTANANAFAASTWVVQRAERDYMFATERGGVELPEGVFVPSSFSALEEAETIVLDNEDYDLFGDGSVVIMSAPGHTQGHQVVAVRLRDYGPVVLAGDLYHYPEEIETGRVPTFEFDAAATRASRQRVQNHLADNGARMWIEHDIATHARLPFAPGYIE